jgi:(2Fe-2S) ferredoxin
MAGRHLFLCTNARSSGKPACGPGGGDALLAAVQRELLARNALHVLVTACDCLGPCFDGPNAVVYPDGVWYAGLALSDAPGLCDHLVSGRALTTKISERPGLAGPDRPVDDADSRSAAAAAADRGNDGHRDGPW